jgi:hypothetical protein
MRLPNTSFKPMVSMVHLELNIFLTNEQVKSVIIQIPYVLL